MADPALINITPKDAWQKVATNITTGRFIIKDASGPGLYYYTYKDTGGAAPTGLTLANVIDEQVEFNNTVGADFYIYAKDAVGKIEAQL